MHIAGGILVLEDTVTAQEHQVADLKAALYHVDDGIGPTVLNHEDTHLGHERRLFFELLFNQAQAHVARHRQVTRDIVVRQAFILSLDELFELGEVKLSQFFHHHQF